MINRMRKLLQEKDFSDWKILVKEEEASQLFYIKKELEQSRSVNILEAKVTLYKDFQRAEGKMRGSAMATFHPTLTDQEILTKLDELYLSAGSAGSPWFPLPEAMEKAESFRENSSFQRHSLIHWTRSIAASIFKADNREKSWINSLEVFLSEIRESFANSRGVEYHYSGYQGLIDLVTTAKDGEGREAELHNEHGFSAYEPEELSTLARRQLEYTEDRIKAVPLPDIPCPSVILREEALPDFFMYWLHASSGEAVYRKIHTTQPGDTLFPGEGDSVSLLGLSRLYNAPESRPYDSSGIRLREREILSDGTLKAYHVGGQFAHYLAKPPTGHYHCYSILPGSLSEEQLYRDPYLEIISFSDFQMDGVTGNFGGEIRLAYWFDGEKSRPVTGGSVTGVLSKTAPSMKMSQEVKKQGFMLCPEAVLLKNLSLTSAG